MFEEKGHVNTRKKRKPELLIAEAKGCLSDGQDEARLAGGKLGQQNTTENEEIAGKRFERSDGFRVHGLCTKACPAPAHSPPSVFVPLCPTACLSPLMTITQTKKATLLEIEQIDNGFLIKKEEKNRSKSNTNNA